MVLSAMGLNLVVFGFLPITHAKASKKTNVSMIFMRHAMFIVCFVFTLRHAAVDAVTYTPDQLKKKSKDPQLEPMPGAKISGVCLWIQQFSAHCIST